jgi:alginate O-acetyltransferase complex protein AlgI
MLAGMLGLHGSEHGLALANSSILAPRRLIDTLTSALNSAPHNASLIAILKIAVLFFIVWTMPNTQQILVRFSPASTRVVPGPFRFAEWKPTLAWGFGITLLFFLVLTKIDNPTRFLYFQF